MAGKRKAAPQDDIASLVALLTGLANNNDGLDAVELNAKLAGASKLAAKLAAANAIPGKETKTSSGSTGTKGKKTGTAGSTTTARSTEKKKNAENQTVVAPSNVSKRPRISKIVPPGPYSSSPPKIAEYREENDPTSKKFVSKFTNFSQPSQDDGLDDGPEPDQVESNKKVSKRKKRRMMKVMKVDSPVKVRVVKLQIREHLLRKNEVLVDMSWNKYSPRNQNGMLRSVRKEFVTRQGYKWSDDEIKYILATMGLDKARNDKNREKRKEKNRLARLARIAAGELVLEEEEEEEQDEGADDDDEDEDEDEDEEEDEEEDEDIATFVAEELEEMAMEKGNQDEALEKAQPRRGAVLDDTESEAEFTDGFESEDSDCSQFDVENTISAPSFVFSVCGKLENNSTPDDSYDDSIEARTRQFAWYMATNTSRSSPVTNQKSSIPLNHTTKPASPVAAPQTKPVLPLAAASKAATPPKPKSPAAAAKAKPVETPVQPKADIPAKPKSPAAAPQTKPVDSPAAPKASIPAKPKSPAAAPQTKPVESPAVPKAKSPAPAPRTKPVETAAAAPKAKAVAPTTASVNRPAEVLLAKQVVNARTSVRTAITATAEPAAAARILSSSTVKPSIIMAIKHLPGLVKPVVSKRTLTTPTRERSPELPVLPPKTSPTIISTTRFIGKAKLPSGGGYAKKSANPLSSRGKTPTPASRTRAKTPKTPTAQKASSKAPLSMPRTARTYGAPKPPLPLIQSRTSTLFGRSYAHIQVPATPEVATITQRGLVRLPTGEDLPLTPVTGPRPMLVAQAGTIAVNKSKNLLTTAEREAAEYRRHFANPFATGSVISNLPKFDPEKEKQAMVEKNRTGGTLRPRLANPVPVPETPTAKLTAREKRRIRDVVNEQEFESSQEALKRVKSRC